MRDQFGADAERCSAGQNVLGSILLIYAAGSDERDVRKGRAQSMNISGTTQLGTGEDFDEVGPGLPGSQDFGWGQDAGKDHDLAADCEMHHVENQSGGGERAGAGIEAA